MFACRRHWFSLPLFMRNAIMLTYRDGQCDDWMPSRKYCEAAKAAVVWLAEKEKRAPDTRVYDFFMKTADIRAEEQVSDPEGWDRNREAVANESGRMLDQAIWEGTK